MKNIISQLIDDFHERKLPEPVNRNKEFPEIKGKADVVTGMRRSGKTWFCYQKIKELIASGTKKEEITEYIVTITFSSAGSRKIVAERLFSQKITGSFISPGPASATDFFIFALPAFTFEILKITQG